jgi:pilus assembly protein CpaC
MSHTPVIGDLMGSDSFRRDETEMVVLVTPYLVEPFGDKKTAEEVPPPADGGKEQSRNAALSAAFANNIRRTYNNRSLKGLFDQSAGYGYIMD